MYVIAINTVTGKPEVACLAIGKDSGILLTAPEEQKQDQGLFVILQDLCLQRAISAENCQQLAVFTGPGRFTWTRSGLAVAKTLAFVWGKSVSAPCVHDLLLAQAVAGQATLAATPAGGSDFYIKAGGQPVQVIPGQGLAEFVSNQNIQQMIGWGWEQLPAAVSIPPSVTKQVFIPTALDLARFAVQVSPVNQTQVLPLYAKPLQLDQVDHFKSKGC